MRRWQPKPRIPRVKGVVVVSLQLFHLHDLVAQAMYLRKYNRKLKGMSEKKRGRAKPVREVLIIVLMLEESLVAALEVKLKVELLLTTLKI